MPASSPLTALALAALAPVAAADVWHVKGPTPDFAEIAPAVVAAQDGDVIRVWPGTYGGFTITDEDLRVVRDPSAGDVVVAGVVRVQSLAAGKTVVLSGLDVNPAGGEALIVYECLGSVRVHGCTLNGAHGNSDPPDFHFRGFDGARIEASPDVAFSSCSLRGGIGVGFELEGAFRGGDGLRATASNVAFQLGDSTGGMGGSPWGQFSAGDGAPGGHGAWIDAGSALFVGGGTLAGGKGGTSGEGCPIGCGLAYGGFGGDGLQVEGSAAFTLDEELVAGEGGAPGTYGLSGPDGSELELDADATLRALRGRARSLSAPALASEGTSIDLVVQGRPGDRVFLASSSATGFQVVPAARGVWLLDGAWPTGPRRIGDPETGHGTVPAGGGGAGTGGGGTLVVPHVLPELPPGTESVTVWFQALVVSADGRAILTDLAPVVVVDETL